MSRRSESKGRRIQKEEQEVEKEEKGGVAKEGP